MLDFPRWKVWLISLTILAGILFASPSMLPKEAKERWMAVLEASYLRELLAQHQGNISAAAKVAGIDRKTFHRLVTKHHIRG